MEKRLVMTLPFSDMAWDAPLQAWLSGSLDPQTRGHVLERLSHDSKFREEFCDWLKTLRSEGWAAEAHKSERAA